MNRVLPIGKFSGKATRAAALVACATRAAALVASKLLPGSKSATFPSYGPPI